jgi:hypothetical protein
VRELSITKQITTTKEGACQAGAEVTAEAHSSLCTICAMAVTQTIAQRIVQSSYNPKQKWSKTTTSLHDNPHLGKKFNSVHRTYRIKKETEFGTTLDTTTDSTTSTHSRPEHHLARANTNRRNSNPTQRRRPPPLEQAPRPMGRPTR